MSAQAGKTTLIGRRGMWGVAAMLAVQAGLLAYLAARYSPTIHEMAHLPAGICHWQYGMFELYRVNPPLPRMVAALPVLCCRPQTDWGNYQLDPLSRETIPMGIRFAKANGARTLFLFMVGRWACIPFCLLGGWVCYRWGRELWGVAAGLMALCLWCANPMILGHGALVMPDVPAAAMGVFAAWRFWKWLRAPTWSAAAMAGLAIGLAELCKTTLLIFFVLWPVAWLAYSSHHAPRDESAGGGFRRLLGSITRSVMPTLRRRSTLQLLAIVLLAVYIINLGYAFRGSCQRLGDYRFQSRLLSGKPSSDPPAVGNRFAGGWLARLPVPLPRDYLQGIDRQRADFESGERSYLHGHWQPRGWWYYYLVGLGIKTPLGTLAAILMAAALTVAGLVRVRAVAKSSLGNALSRRGIPSAEDGLPTPPLPPGEGWGEGESQGNTPNRAIKATWRDELFLLASGIAIFVLVSSQTGFSNHVRYAIPALPFLFIWCGKLFAPRGGGRNLCRERPLWRSVAMRLGIHRFLAERHRGRSLQILIWLCVAATFVESFSTYPHSISFFNLFVGGSGHGHEWLLDSNLASGQDLVFLKEWVAQHPEARPLRLASVGWLDPRVLGIDYTLPPVGPSRPLTDDDRARIDHRSHHRVPSGWRDANPRAKRQEHGVPQVWEDVASVGTLGPHPGWYIIDANFLNGAGWCANKPGWRFQRIAEEGLSYEYFNFFEPHQRVGYSYFVYHISAGDADRVRHNLGLPASAAPFPD